MQTNICHRLTARTLILAVLLTISGTVHAIGTETTITLRPHCLLGYEEDNTVLKDGGDPEQIRCPSFSVEDPQTLKTPDLRVGDILDLDIVVENPEEKDIARIRAWLAYDPNILQGDVIEISEEYSVVTPGESDFDTTEGYAKIEASSEGSGADDLQLFVARVQFTVLKTTPGGTVVNFFDVQTGGHTSVATGKDEEEEHLITREPGALHVVFAEEEVAAPAVESSSSAASITAVSSAPAQVSSASAASVPAELLTDGEACITNEQCRSSRCLSGICQGATPLAAGAACGSNEQCLSGSCVNNACVGGIPAVSSAASSAPAVSSQSTLTAVGGACQSNGECQSELCISNVCIPSLDSQRQENPSSVAPVPTAADNSAFSLLQVQNVRVTTEGSAIYLGWEALNSSQLKAYNVYYGTTTGRYIQRKTVESSVKSLAIRSLPLGTTYYFAVRAVNMVDQESAFSQEIAVTVGDPKTSTAPLAAGSIPTDGPGKNPVQGSVTGDGGTVPGATGIPSIALTLALLSAVIGTGFASRRQMVALTDTPQA
ncbi:hypothetical protein A3F36_04790 [Candidatus Peribacteria bacterium RIFCSPHIGHO2_12_FULL_55_11]|nr:MAG: hypothetical protein A3F36_04790 [Candidatus Peribacteria bacterium RIFCSPHIGHO2_12_FULL_55_11]